MSFDIIFFSKNDPERIQPVEPSNHHHNIEPKHDNHIITNHTIDDNPIEDISFTIMSTLFHLFVLFCVYECGRKCFRYFRNSETNNINNNDYSQNRVILIEEVKDNDCSICLEPLHEDCENNREIISLKCKHLFHRECIHPWVTVHKCCPLCKRIT